MTRYTEFQITSNFSFLRGASHPEELVEQAAAYGYSAIAITDRNTFAGIVRAHTKARASGIRLIPGCRLDLVDGPSLLALPTSREAYSRLSNLLTLGNRRTEKGKCELYREDVYAYAKGSKFIVIPPSVLNESFDFHDAFKKSVHEYRDVFGADLSLSASRVYDDHDIKRIHRIYTLSKKAGVSMVATNDVHYHHPSRRELQDVVSCVREKCTIHNAGFKLYANAERHLKTMEEMKRLFRQYPQAVEQTQVLEETCRFSLTELKYQYPKEVTPDGRTPQEELARLAWEGAGQLFHHRIPEKVKEMIAYELDFIGRMNYAEYFLTVYDIVRFARSRGILCQGRGSAANSTVCYCLGITSVDPSRFDLLFERFISSARNEPPDIDVDFEHERREEVIQYIYEKYGRDRAAIVATVTQQHHKGAIRDVGKAMGISADTITRLSELIWDFHEDGFDRQRIVSQGINPDDPTIRKILALTEKFMGFPRQLGQHTGGFVITEGKLSDLCPILNARMEDRTNIEWNKDDIDAMGFMKIDVLALGMLTCIRKGFDLIKKHYGVELTLAGIPQDDPAVYEMISHADTIGVFQIESRAQQSMLPRLRPKCFYDLVIEVAIVRPGPIQGDMVHPYLRRRNGEEPVEYPSKELEDILRRTLGVPLFQEQAMKIAIVAAGFTPAEADELRRSMATFRAKGEIARLEQKLISGMVKNGYSLEYAKRVFRQLEGFGSYGFPESHAVSFALLVYVSAWIKYYYPEVFACALLNSMPMGFYQPAQIVIDAERHGVVVRPPDVNFSGWDNTLEEKEGKYFVLRLGLRQVKGMREEDVHLLVKGKKNGYTTLHELREAGLSDAALEKLANADAFRSMDLDRRQALWDTSAKDKPHLLFQPESEDTHGALPPMSLFEHVVQDYAATSLSVKAHPVSFVREQLGQLNILSSATLQDKNNGDQVKVAGLVLVRQRPGTASGICFITLEDETGTANLVVFRQVFDKYRREIIQSRLLMVEGILQREGEVIHVIVKKCFNFNRLLYRRSAGESKKTAEQDRVFHEGRNFR